MHKIFTHGSEDSLDHDVYVIFDNIPSFKEAKAYCNSLTEMNANILVLKEGIVDWCFKGTEDECNNSLFMTYALHEQSHQLPIMELVERDIPLKLVRTIRGLLSYFSRTELRTRVKQALRSDSFEEKISVLRDCQLSTEVDFKKTTHIEVFKFFAFQLGQTRALLESNVELFTKSSVAEYYPILRPFLYREVSDPTVLQNFFIDFLDFIEDHIQCTEKGYVFDLSETVQPFSFVERSKF